MPLLFIAQTAWAQKEWREYPGMESGWYRDADINHGYDDDNRVMVMITFNNDIADGWQRADEYYYPEEAANASIRLGVNFAVYALTH